MGGGVQSRFGGRVLWNVFPSLEFSTPPPLPLSDQTLAFLSVPAPADRRRESILFFANVLGVEKFLEKCQ